MSCSCNFLAGLVQPLRADRLLPGLREDDLPTLLVSYLSQCATILPSLCSRDLSGSSLFQMQGALCLHGSLARLQATLPATAHRQASLPTSPAPLWLRPG